MHRVPYSIINLIRCVKRIVWQLIRFLAILLQWDGNLRMTGGIFGWLGNRGIRNRRIVVGLKSDNCSREMLMRVLQVVAVRGDAVLAVHVQQEFDDTFDPNTFQICEDLCKSKQVEFEVKICNGSCYITELAHQVRIAFATILAVGCSSNSPESSTIAKYLKALPPSCKLLIMDNGGKILHQEMGTSQQGSCTRARRSFVSSLSESSTSGIKPPVRKSVSMPSSSESAKNCHHLHDFPPKFFQRSAVLEAKSNNRNFTLAELNRATDNFCPNMLVGEGSKSRVYKGVLENGQAVAVKVLKASQYAEEFFFQEVEILNSLKHENIVRIVGYCYCREMYTIVYNLLSSSLKQRLNQLKWSERMQIALGVAKALEYLHSSYPPIIHTDVNSSNVLLSEDGKPQLSDFGSAKVHFSTHQSSTHKRPVHVIGTFGYLAPEYIMYGKVDEKVDVYSFGTLLLELITGKEAIRPSNQESLALRARSLLTCGLDERIIDPSLTEDYNKDEAKAMMIVARLCLLHSSSRRPTMKTISHFLEEPNYVLEIQKKSGDLHSQIEPEVKIEFRRHAKSDSSGI